MQFRIRLNTPEDVSVFSKIINQCNYDVDLVSGHTFIDAKSILGLYSINLHEYITIDAHCDDHEAVELMAKLVDYIGT